MAAIDKVERKFAPLTGTESDIAWAMLDFYRNTLLTKCRTLSDDQLMRAAVHPSPLTLLGLLRHMTEVERYWFEECILGQGGMRPVWRRHGRRHPARSFSSSGRSGAQLLRRL